MVDTCSVQLGENQNVLWLGRASWCMTWSLCHTFATSSCIQEAHRSRHISVQMGQRLCLRATGTDCWLTGRTRQTNTEFVWPFLHGALQFGVSCWFLQIRWNFFALRLSSSWNLIEMVQQVPKPVRGTSSQRAWLYKLCCEPRWKKWSTKQFSVNEVVITDSN